MSMAHRKESNVAIMAELLTTIGDTLNGASPAASLAFVLVMGGLVGLLAGIHEDHRAVR